MAVKVCPNCSVQNLELDAKYCKNCGVDLELGAKRSALQRQVVDLQARARALSSGSPLPPPPSGVDPAEHQMALDEATRLNAEVARLGSLLKQAQAKGGKGTTAAALQKAEADAARFQAEATRLDGALKKVLADLRKAQADLAGAPNSQTLAQLRAAKDAAELELQRVRAEVQSLTRDLQTQTALAAQLPAVQVRVRELERELTTRPTQAQLDRLNADLRTAGAQLNSETLRADGAEARLRTESAEVARLNREVTRVEAEVQRLQGVERQLRREVHDRDTRIDQFERSMRTMKYALIGAGAFGGFVAFVVATVVFGFGVALPLALLAGQVIVIYRAEWVLDNQGPTAIGWGVLMGPALLLTAGMWIQIGGVPVVSWTVMNLYGLILPAAVFARARKP